MPVLSLLLPGHFDCLATEQAAGSSLSMLTDTDTGTDTDTDTDTDSPGQWQTGASVLQSPKTQSDRPANKPDSASYCSPANGDQGHRQTDGRTENRQQTEEP